MRSEQRIAIAAASAVVLQALVSVLALGWVKRLVAPAAVGLFGFGLTIVNLALALDGIRQVVVVQAVRDGGESAEVRKSATTAIFVGFVASILVLLVSTVLGGVALVDRLALTFACFAVLTVGPSLGFLEAMRGPAIALALHAMSWSAGLLLTSVLLVVSEGRSGVLWGLAFPPLLIGVFLSVTGHFVRPAWNPHSSVSDHSLHGVLSNVATAVTGSLDRLLLWGLISPAALGQYVPLAELVGRGHALSGLISGLFLRSESRSVLRDEHSEPPAGWRTVSDSLFAFASLGVLICALGANLLCRLYLGADDSDSVLTFRILLLTLATGFGAQWVAMQLRARGYFAFHWMYGLSSAVALLAAPFILAERFAEGAVVYCLVRTADLLVLWKGRRFVSPVQWGSMVAAFIGVISTILF